MLGHRTLNAEDVFAILKRRWWVVCVPAVIVPIAAVIATYFLTPRYDSTSQILIDQQKVSPDVVRPMDLGSLEGQLNLTTAQIKSRSTLEPIINKYNLYASQHLSMEARVEQLRTKDLQVAPIETEITGANGLPGFKVTVTADDPRTAQQVCADITGLYTQNSLLTQRNMTAGTTQFLQSQLADETRKLDDMDQKLATFKSEHLGALPGEENSTSSILGSLNSQLEAANQQIRDLQQRKEVLDFQMQEARRDEAPTGITAKTVDADQAQLDKLQNQLADLKLHYSEEYPDVRATERLIAEQKAKIARAAAAPPEPTPAAPPVDSSRISQLTMAMRLTDQNIASAQKQQQSIQAQMGSQEGRLQASPVVEQQYQELTRDYQTETNIYNKLLAQLGEAQQSTDLQNRQEGETFTLLDMANLPVDATFPKQSVFALGGLGGGLALGLLIVAFLEYRDTALRTERDIWSFTQLPTLAVIAYSGDITAATAGKTGLFKRLFSRKDPKELLAG